MFSSLLFWKETSGPYLTHLDCELSSVRTRNLQNPTVYGRFSVSIWGIFAQRFWIRSSRDTSMGSFFACIIISYRACSWGSFHYCGTLARANSINSWWSSATISWLCRIPSWGKIYSQFPLSYSAVHEKIVLIWCSLKSMNVCRFCRPSAWGDCSIGSCRLWLLVEADSSALASDAC